MATQTSKASDKVQGRRIVSKKVSHTVEHQKADTLEIEKVQSICKTACKTFGGPFLDEMGNFVGDCSLDHKKCKCENAEVRALCIIESNPEIMPISEKGKKGKKGEESDSLKKIIAFLDTPKSMKELQLHMGTKTTLYNICGRHSDKIARVGKLFVDATKIPAPAK